MRTGDLISSCLLAGREEASGPPISQIASDHSAMIPPARKKYLSLTGIEPVSSLVNLISPETQKDLNGKFLPI